MRCTYDVTYRKYLSARLIIPRAQQSTPHQRPTRAFIIYILYNMCYRYNMLDARTIDHTQDRILRYIIIYYKRANHDDGLRIGQWRFR